MDAETLREEKMMPETKPPELIVALDVEDGDLAIALVKDLDGVVGFFKVGSRLFTACGPGIIGDIKDAGAGVFLDLKFHDIPATVAGSVKAAVEIGADMLTIHTSGGADMMRAAAEAASEQAEKLSRRKPVLVGVTVLTSLSTDELSEVFGYTGDIPDLVMRLAGLARESGLDGVVSSVWEAGMIREGLGGGFVIVTPGIRPGDSAIGDQKRVATPRDALMAGADYIVVGRPIIKAPSPRAAAVEILNELGYDTAV